MDSDTDGYPDGFEVMHQMDPMSKDAANVKVIPLGAELGYGETIRVHAEAKDYTGHLRKSIPVAAGPGG